MSAEQPDTRPARWEVVRGDAEQPWHVRLVGANGETVMVSEQYADRRDAIAAIALAAGQVRFSDVDERTPAPAVCPECAVGKHVACDGTALAEATDEIVGCACAESGHT